MSQRDTSLERQILTSHDVTSLSSTVQAPASAPPPDVTRATAIDPIPEYTQTPAPALTESESGTPRRAEACARALWQKAYDYHHQQGLRADHSLEVKSTEQLVQYMMQERGWEEAAAREAISIYPARVLAKLHRKTPNGMPTVGQLRTVSDEEWEEKSR